MLKKDKCYNARLVPFNASMGAIPEGFVRRSNKEFIQFLFISISSAAELQSHFYVALDRKYVSQETFDRIYQQVDKAGKMCSSLITYLRECDRKYAETKQTRMSYVKGRPQILFKNNFEYI